MAKWFELLTNQSILVVLVLGLTVISTLYVYDIQATEIDFTGKYYSTDGYIELRHDGSFIVEQEHPFSGEYTINDDKLTLYYGFGKFEAQIIKDKIIDADGDTWIKK